MTDLLEGGSNAPVFSPKTVGETIKGTITGIAERQQFKFGTKTPDTWDGGEPKMEHVITVLTAERDSAIEDDDGERRIIVPQSSKMLAAIKQAAAEAKIGNTAGLVGATIAVQYIGVGEPSKPGYNPPKLFRAQIVAPVASVSTSDLL